MSEAKVILALIMGATFGILTLALVRNPVSADGVGILAVFLLPGFLAGIIASSNVHDPNTWVATLGNFLFYFAVTYFVLVARERLKRGMVERGK